jgi:hypothetical protein
LTVYRKFYIVEEASAWCNLAREAAAWHNIAGEATAMYIATEKTLRAWQLRAVPVGSYSKKNQDHSRRAEYSQQESQKQSRRVQKHNGSSYVSPLRSGGEGVDNNKKKLSPKGV